MEFVFGIQKLLVARLKNVLTLRMEIVLRSRTVFLIMM